MVNLPIWALWPITIAVWASLGLSILSARSFTRLLHRLLWPRPEEAPRPGREPPYEEPAAVATLRG
jgi:hypothetical protein